MFVHNSIFRYVYRFFIAAGLGAISTSALAETQYHETNCGIAKFWVTAQNPTSLYTRGYTLSGRTVSGYKTLFTSEEGDGFDAACLTTKNRTPLLVFQSSCSGSGCLEGKYGAVDPTTLKFLLRPSTKNIENHRQLTAILGYTAPDLYGFKSAFCCGKQ